MTRRRPEASASGRGRVGELRWRPSIVGSADGSGWSSREEQARAAQLDREIDAQNQWGTVARGDADRDWAGRLVEPQGGPELDELSEALAVAAGLRRLADGCPEPRADSLQALRAATSAFHGRGPWRAMPPAGRLAMSGAGAVAAAVIGAVAWSGVTGSGSGNGGIQAASVASAATKIRLASLQISQASQALADGDPVKAKQLLGQAKINSATASALLPSSQALSSTGKSSSLPAQLAQEGATIANLQKTVDSYQAAADDTTRTTTTTKASTSSTSTPPSSTPPSSTVTSVPLVVLPSGSPGSGTAGTCATTTTTSTKSTTTTTVFPTATTTTSTTVPLLGVSDSTPATGIDTPSEADPGGVQVTPSLTPAGIPSLPPGTASATSTTSTTSTTTGSTTSTTACNGPSSPSDTGTPSGTS